MNFEPFRSVGLELALNSRISTGGFKVRMGGGELSNQPLTKNQAEFIFWCLSRTPHINTKTVEIECNGKMFDRKTLTLDSEKIPIKPTKYPRTKCPSIRLHWVNSRDLRNVSFSTSDENAYLLEHGMGQEMVHVAGSIAQVGVNMIGGVDVDLVPMIPYYSSEPPLEYRKSNLPEPIRDGKYSAMECIEDWKPSETFKQKKISQSQLGQLLWAGYGCTPHKTYKYHRYGALGFEGQGKTIPSAAATYTTALYVIEKDGIFKYVNWDDEKNAAIHSLGIIKKGDELKIGEIREGGWEFTGKTDLKRKIRQLVPMLPSASTYITVASNGRLLPYFSLMEAGYSVLHILLQAQALEIANNIVVLSQDQMTKIRGTIGLRDTPIALMAIGLS